MGNNRSKNSKLFLGKIIAFVLMILFIILSSTAKSQVYNYDPIRHTNSEINPAYLASNKNNFSSSLIHQGALFDSHRFYYDAVHVSFYSQKYYSGIGLTLSNTNINDSIYYRYAGIGAAYRIILFDKIYTKIGGIYKILDTKSPSGVFNYYSFQKNAETETKKNLITNANASISFSSENDSYYLSAGILNFSIQKNEQDLARLFPKYYFLNVGDFAKMLEWDRWELSYSMFGKTYKKSSPVLYSHYLSIHYTGFQISRNSGIKCGVRIGVTDYSYMQCSPALSFYKRIKKRKDIICQLMYDFGVSTQTKKLPFNPTTQLNLSYQF